MKYPSSRSRNRAMFSVWHVRNVHVRLAMCSILAETSITTYCSTATRGIAVNALIRNALCSTITLSSTSTLLYSKGTLPDAHVGCSAARISTALRLAINLNHRKTRSYKQGDYVPHSRTGRNTLCCGSTAWANKIQRSKSRI